MAGIICGIYIMIKGKERLVKNNKLNTNITEIKKCKSGIL